MEGKPNRKMEIRTVQWHTDEEKTVSRRREWSAVSRTAERSSKIKTVSYLLHILTCRLLLTLAGAVS